MWSWRALGWALMLGMAGPQQAGALDYYVSLAGSDGNAGTAPGHAWQTLAHVSGQASCIEYLLPLRGVKVVQKTI